MLTEEQEDRLTTAFRPHAAIEQPEGFIGRQVELRQVSSCLRTPGLHCVVYGERGCGKTSLTNVATVRANRLRVFCEKEATFADICRSIALEYQESNPDRVEYDIVTETLSVAGVRVPVGKIDGNTLLRLLPRDESLCIVLDEVDRIEDKAGVGSLAELVKNASTKSPRLTFVFVGVAETAEELLAGHASNFRNLRQVLLPRMTPDELRQILQHGSELLELDIGDDIGQRLIDISDRMPYYLHLLATAVCRSVLEAGRDNAIAADLNTGLATAAKDADQSLRDDYTHAILSPKNSQIYRRVLWAIAQLDPASPHVSNVYSLVNSIAASEGAAEVSNQAIGQAIKKLKTSDKRRILESRVMGTVKFRKPLMKGFVRISRALEGA